MVNVDPVAYGDVEYASGQALSAEGYSIRVYLDLNSARFSSLLASSKYDQVPGFAEERKGHIVLQDHGDDVWFRNIKIRELPRETP